MDAAQTRSTPIPPRSLAELGLSLGAGRSGVVFLSQDEQGRAVARKVFDSDLLTRAVQYLFLGAPNPYAWNEHAVQCAVLRRRILTQLVRHWFGGRLRVADAWSQDFNRDHLAYQLHTEFVDGKAPTLHHPMNRRGAQEVEELVEEIMRPLQRRLEESGFDGLVWQAGRGNPVALGNFLRIENDGRDGREGPQWAWIDLESGVPALFPLDPRPLFSFYLPRSLKLGRPLFDDVDVAKLRDWMQANALDLRCSLGQATFATLEANAESLRFHQHEWKSQPRLQRALNYQLRKEVLSPEDAEYYATRPWRWRAREVRRLSWKCVRKIGSKTVQAVERVRRFPYRRLTLGILGFLTSQRFRTHLAKRFASKRIDSWESRGQLTELEVARLRAHLDGDESTVYLTDFGAHMAIKPFVKGVEYFVIPGLYAAGLVTDSSTLWMALLLGGCLGRTLYTLGRLVYSSLRGEKLPWTALWVGALPIVGNLAYPMQIVRSSRDDEDLLAQFILYDGCSAIGRKVPIWGGRDTFVEHWFNHLPDRVVPGR